MSRFRPSLATVAVALTLLAAEACQDATAMATSQDLLGAPARLGGGEIHTFARIDGSGVPLAIGVVIPDQVLSTLPTERSDRHRCFDVNANGTIEEETECLPTHERVLPLPSQIATRADVPFKWMLFNWNPVGHAPPAIFDVPHFDIHYFMDSIENTFALMPGPCGPELIQCDQFERARVPVPSMYVPGDFQNVDAAAPAMGNHLIDLTSHEFHGSPFDRAWIFGAYEGRVTFWEEMVTLAFVQDRPDDCFSIKTPSAYEVAGYYPTRVCYAFDGDRSEHRQSLEGFVYRDATSRSASAN